jgi:hypothetical protein
MIFDARLKGVWMPVTLRMTETGGSLPWGNPGASHGGFNEKNHGKNIGKSIIIFFPMIFPSFIDKHLPI